MKKLLLLPVVLMTLPAATCETRKPGVEIRTVEIPVLRACVSLEVIPAELSHFGDRLAGDCAQDLPIVAASALELRAWGREMHAALVTCAN